MKAYLDTSAIIPFLYQKREEPGRRMSMEDVFAAACAGHVEVAISFYLLPELYSFVHKIYVDQGSPLVFRESLVALFSEPVTIYPHLDWTESNRLRRRFTIADPYDALHVATAIFHRCDAIVTYDAHFQAVADVIPVYTPEELLSHVTEMAENDTQSE